MSYVSLKTKQIRQLAPRPLGLYMMFLTGGEQLKDLFDRFLPNCDAYQEIWDKLNQTPQSLPLNDFLQGVSRYRQFDWQRQSPDYDVVCTYNRAQLLQCSTEINPESESILLIPSMVNRSYILDLMPDTSLVQFLKNQGYNVYLLDWLDPIADDLTSHSNIDEAIEDIICAAIDEVYSQANNKIHLAGYCMGGTLAFAAATLRQDLLKSLTLIASPWDFSKQPYAPVLETSQTWGNFFLKNTAVVPIDVLQGLFVIQDPASAVKRLSAYAKIEDDEQLKRMTAIEDWLSDGMILEGKIAQYVYKKWFIENAPYQQRWWVNNHLISPLRVHIPVCFVTAENDQVVPVSSSLALKGQLNESQTEQISVKAGHIGLMVGRKAITDFYTPWDTWLKKL